MTVTSTTSARRRRTPFRRARDGAARRQGQWAKGHREPLNANEQAKKDDNPLNVRARIENIYAHRGFESIDKGDLRGPVPLVGALHPTGTGSRRHPHR